MNLEKILENNTISKDKVKQRTEFVGPQIDQARINRAKTQSIDDSIIKPITMRLTFDTPPAMRLFDICHYVDCE